MIKLTDAGTEILLATEKITKLTNRIEDLEGEIIYLREILREVYPKLLNAKEYFYMDAYGETFLGLLLEKIEKAIAALPKPE